MSAPAFDAVLFDLDGTLVDSFDDIAASANHALVAVGRAPLPAPLIKSYVGEGIHVLMRRALGSENPDLIARAVASWRPHYEAHCLDRTLPYDGIVPLLQSLAAAGVKLGVVSNKLEGLTVATVNGLGWKSLFGAVVGGDTTPQRKPDAAPLRHAAARLGVTGGRILVVGDTANDLGAARAAGWPSCAVAWGQIPGEELRKLQPDFLVRHPREIEAIVLGSRPQPPAAAGRVHEDEPL